MIRDVGLRDRLKRGQPVTLVLGAGVSKARGLPLWTDLLRSTYKAALDRDPYEDDAEFLNQARLECLRIGLPPAFVERLDVARHPFELQFAFEQIFNHFRWSDSSVREQRRNRRRRGPPRQREVGTNEARALERFGRLVRRILYRDEVHRKKPGARPDTLTLVARAVRRSATASGVERKVTQVITFNVDDLLEREVNAHCRRRIPFAVPISRACAFRPLPVRSAIPIYHIHGFLPANKDQYPLFVDDGWIPNAPPLESLVFTDEQYWRTVGNPTGFASRIFTSALSGTCVFIGVSMTDVNIIRLLAQDAIERSDDFRRLTARWGDPTEAEFNLTEDLSRHYWITVRKDGPYDYDLVRNGLGRRGVNYIEIPSWDSDEFRKWWEKRFLS